MALKWIPIPLMFFLLTTTTFLLLLPIIVHGLKVEDLGSLRLELINRHDPRVIGRNRNIVGRTQFQLLKDLAHKDMFRYRRMFQTGERSSHRRKDWEVSLEMPMHSGKDYGVGEYFVQVKVGTPPQMFWLIADAGSDLSWVNCKCDCGKDCGSPKMTKPGGHHKKVFHAGMSSTFKPVPCSSNTCKSVPFSLTSCNSPLDPCQYNYSYVDGSSAEGFFANETLTVDLADGDRNAKLENMIIGCTRSVVAGPVLGPSVDGVLGLGYSKDSFAVKTAGIYGGKFSYCLVDHLSPKNVSNYLTFGNDRPNTTVLLANMQYTKLSLLDPLYGLSVLGISIGGKMLDVPPKVWDLNAGAGAILDSGTSLFLLARPAYDPMMAVLTMALGRYQKLDDNTQPFEFCFNATGFDETLVPRISFHFEGGARFEPPVKSYVIDNAPQEKCIGILPVPLPGATVIGNIMQQNYYWEFDLLQGRVGFAPSSCTK